MSPVIGPSPLWLDSFSKAPVLGASSCGPVNVCGIVGANRALWGQEVPFTRPGGAELSPRPHAAVLPPSGAPGAGKKEHFKGQTHTVEDP